MPTVQHWFSGSSSTVGRMIILHSRDIIAHLYGTKPACLLTTGTHSAPPHYNRTATVDAIYSYVYAASV